MKLFALLQFADAATTWFGIRFAGNTEANPLVRLLITHDPLMGLVIVKGFAFVLFGLTCWKAPRILRDVNRFYMVLAAWNLVCIAVQVLR